MSLKHFTSLVLSLCIFVVYLEAQTPLPGSISTNTTLLLSESPYQLNGDVTVEEGVTLTIEAGVEVFFPDDFIDLFVRGTLVAEGTAGNPIRFYGSNPSEFEYGGAVVFTVTSSGNILDHVIIERMGDNWGNYDAAVYIDRADVSITNCSFPDLGSGGRFVRVTKDTPSLLTVSNNNDISLVHVQGGTISQSASWSLIDVPYVLDFEDLTIAEGTTVTFPAGLELWFPDDFVDLLVGGTLIADGTAGNPIRFYGSNPSEFEYGGAVVFTATSSGSVLNHVTLERMGDNWGNFDTVIYIDGADVSVTNCLFPDLGSGGRYIRLTTDTPPLVELADNAIPYVHVNGGTISADAIWPALDVPYIMDGSDLEVPESHTLTFLPGLELWFPDDSRDLLVRGTLLAQGTALDTIRFYGSNPSSSEYGGTVRFYPSSTGSIMDYVELERMADGSNSLDAAIYVDQAELSVTHCSFPDLGSGGRYIRLTTDTPPLVEIANNAIPFVHVIGGAIGADATWPALDVPYIMDNNDLEVPETRTLTFLPGLELWFPDDSRDLQVRGTLLAQGTAVDTIRFYGSNPSSFEYGGTVRFYPSSTGSIMDYVELERMGDLSNSLDAAIYVDLAALTITHCSFPNLASSSRYIRLTTDTPPLVEIANNAIPFVHVNGGTIGADATWPALEIPYIMDGSDLEVPESRTLTFPPGLELWFPDDSRDLQVRGTLLAQGTAVDTIRFYGSNPSSFEYGGTVRFYPSSTGSIMDYVELERMADGSNTLDAAIYVDQAELSVTHCSFPDLGSGGRYIRLTTDSPSGVHIADNAIPFVHIIGGIISADATWPTFDVPYVLDLRDLEVPDSLRLTLTPGLELWFPDDALDLQVRGTLLAQGTASDTIRFLGSNSSNFEYGGTLRFYPTSTGNLIDYLQMERMGDNSSNLDAAIYLDRATLALTNSVFTDIQAGRALRVTPNSPARLTLNNNSFSTVHVIGSGLEGSVEWPDLGPSYTLDGDLTIPLEDTLSLAAGTELWFPSTGTDIAVYGLLQADGTPANPIRFWGSSGNANTGGTIFLFSDGEAQLNHTRIERLGDLSSSWNTAVQVRENATLSLTNSEIFDLEFRGITVEDNTDVTLFNNCFSDIGSHAVLQQGDQQLNAQNNYWGSADGPSPTGAGESISGNVLFEPFLAVCTQTITDDLALVGILAPTANCDLSTTETVTVRVANVGLSDQSSFQLSYRIDGGTPVVENVAMALPAGQSLDYTFSVTADLSSIGIYDITAAVISSGDLNLGNNELSIAVEHFFPLDVQTSDDATLCAGEGVVISTEYRPTYTYQWSNGLAVFSFVEFPEQTTTYMVTVTDTENNRCVDVDTVVVTVLDSPERPLIDTSPDLLCAGGTAEVFVSNGISGNLIWNTGQTGPSITVSQAGVYYVTNVNANGCSVQSPAIWLGNDPTPSLFTSGDGVICGTESELLQVTYGTDFQWSTGETSASIEVTPTENTTYSVTVTTPNDCVHVLQRTIIVASDIPPGGAPEQLLPPDGAQNLALPLELSWAPVANTTHYDIYIWLDGQAEPSTDVSPTYRTTQIRQLIFSGLAYGQTYRWKVCARNECAEADPICSTVQAFTLNFLPDLLVPPNSIQRADTLFTGTEFVVEWQVSNQGLGSTQGISANGNWLDACFLSTDPELSFDDRILGTQVNPLALLSGAGYTNEITAVLPENMPAGEYYLIVCTDRYGNMPESNEGNNCSASPEPFAIITSPYPDLTVTNLPPPDGAAGNIVFPGDSYTLNWTVENQNTGPNSSATDVGWWYDRVYLSRDSFFNIQTAGLVETVRHDGDLLVGETYATAFDLQIPASATDTLYVFVCTDATDREYEFIFEDNNCRRSVPLAVNEFGKPDFWPQGLTVPDTASNLEYIEVSWSVLNTGADYNGSLTDRLYLNTEPSLMGAVSIGGASEFFGTDTLFNFTTYTGADPLFVPNGLNGWHYVLLVSNANNTVEESDFTNNMLIDSIFIQSPNLTVSAVSYPAEATSGQSIAINWTVTNTGPGDLFSTSVADRVRLVSTGNPENFFYLNPVVGNLTTFAGDDVVRQQTYHIPDGFTGEYCVEVTTNYPLSGGVFENGQYTDNSLLLCEPLRILPAAYPNLVAQSVGSSSTNATAGDAITVDYSVQNVGTAATSGNWADRIYLSDQVTWNPVGALLLRTEIQSQVIAAETGQYQRSLTVALPTGLPADNYYLYLVTDANQTVFELNENDNIRRSVLPLSVAVYPEFDLTFAGPPLGPASIEVGESANVLYTVVNDGSVPTPGDIWYDAVYLSEDPSWETTDLLVAEWQRTTALAANATYQRLETFTVPAGLDGTFYMFLVVDHQNDVSGETSESNNVRQLLRSGSDDPVVITYPPRPDLAIAALDVPPSGTAGQSITIAYEIQNIATEGEALGTWTEAAYLSTDQQLSANDLYLGQQISASALAPGTSYQVQQELTLPLGVSGNYFLLLRSDPGNVLAEADETNNLRSAYIFLTQPAPGDLQVLAAAIEPPPTDTIATDVTISWQTSNLGQNPLAGNLEEGVYLSEDAVWDAGDLLLGVWQGVIGLEPGAQATHTLTARLEGVRRRDYYVFVKTDLQDNFLEDNEENNCSLGPVSIFVAVPELPIGPPATAAVLERERPIYYRIEVPLDTVGETMRVSLSSTDQSAFNELYLRHDDVPSRTEFDLSFTEPFVADQSLLVPSLEAGTYYVLAYAVEGTPVQEVELLAEIIPFQIAVITANSGGNTGQVTALLEGAKFHPGMSVRLSEPTLGDIPAGQVQVVNSTRAFVTFPLSGAAIGVYDVVAQDSSGAVAILPAGFTVVSGSVGNAPLLAECSLQLGNQVLTVTNVPAEVEVLEFEPVHPTVVRPNQIVPITLKFTNTGDVDVPVPSRIFSSLNEFPLGSTTTDLANQLDQLSLTFAEEDGPTNVLRPGAVAFVTVYSRATQSEGVMKFRLLSNR